MTPLRRGTSLIDLLISIAIIAVLFGGIYLIYFSLITAISNISVRAAASGAVQAEIETVRNLPYASVGTVGGVPSGVIPPTQTVSYGNYSFVLQTTVRNIDDPFDGTVNGTPADTAPADYKLVEITATCPICNGPVALTITTTVAPKSLESASDNGSLFVYALDANGNPVSGAAVHVVNASATPSIDLTDTTNGAGVLQLVGVPTSTQSYQVTVTKSGYSTDQTYAAGSLGASTPAKPNATVAAQTVTSITFSIDVLSTLAVSSVNNRCAPVANEPFFMQGTKLIGTNPDVLKFSTSSATGASGTITFQNIEWDTYALALADAGENVAGTIPLSPLIVNPSSTATFMFVLQPAANPSLLAATVDSATGAEIPGAAITASKTGFSKTLIAGHAFYAETDWSGGQYASQSGGIDVSSPGKLALLLNASGTYDVGTNDWLISNTIDLGGTSTTLYTVAWNPVNQPAQTSLQFQIAGNSDNATWNFIGPDGTGATFFAASSSLPASLSGNRYVRYKAYLSTQDQNATPELDDVTVEFSGSCVPQSQALFTGLPQGSYTVNTSALNYEDGSTTVSVGSGPQSVSIPMIHLQP